VEFEKLKKVLFFGEDGIFFAKLAFSAVICDLSESAPLRSEVTECDQTESDQTRHYAPLESDKALFGMR
jgi:hypothetical protein